MNSRFFDVSNEAICFLNITADIWRTLNQLSYDDVVRESTGLITWWSERIYMNDMIIYLYVFI